VGSGKRRQNLATNMIKKFFILTTLACLTVATAQAGWIYLVPGYDLFGYRDRNGVLHVFQAGPSIISSGR
jgi:hypothetical protein